MYGELAVFVSGVIFLPHKRLYGNQPDPYPIVVSLSHVNMTKQRRTVELDCDTL